MSTLSNCIAWAGHRISWKCVHLSLSLGCLQDVRLFSGMCFGTEKNKVKINICRGMGCQNDINSFRAASLEHVSWPQRVKLTLQCYNAIFMNVM